MQEEGERDGARISYYGEQFKRGSETCRYNNVVDRIYKRTEKFYTFYFAAGKLNALEDWRLARLDLMHKFEVQEEQIAKQEESHKMTLYETEKSVIIAKAK